MSGEATQADIAAALSHLGFDSVADLHYWATNDNDLNRFDALVQLLAHHRTAENERLDQRETELMAELSGLDQFNAMLVDLVRRAMRLIPEGKSLWWDQADAALSMMDSHQPKDTPNHDQ